MLLASMPGRYCLLRTAILCWLLGAGSLGSVYGQSLASRADVREAGLPTDPVDLLALLQRRAQLASEPRRLQALIARLGADSFSEREQALTELKAAGPFALPLLRQALRNSDKETVRRARECIAHIRREIDLEALEAALPRVAARKQSSSVKRLLDYLPYAANEGVVAALSETLAVVAFREGRPAAEVYAALTDKEPVRRAAALALLNRATPPEPAARFSPFLTDSDAAVRLEAAVALAQRGQRSAVPVLIALLKETPPTLAWRAEGYLRRIAGRKAPFLALQATEDSRRKCSTAWQTWWERSREHIDFRHLNLDDSFHGLMLVADLDEGRILALGLDHKERWRLEGCCGPVDVQALPSGRLLVAENHARRVTERDLQSRIVWEARITGYPLSCWRLPSGNTCIATRTALLEINPQGQEVRKYTPPDVQNSDDPYRIFCARGLRNGWRAVLLRNGTPQAKIIFLDESGETVRTIKFTANHSLPPWTGLTILANGHFLTQVESTPAGELNRYGEIVWKWSRKDAGGKPIQAVSPARLPNGHILVCDWSHYRVVEVRRDGEVVWEYATEGRPSCVHVLP